MIVPFYIIFSCRLFSLVQASTRQENIFREALLGKFGNISYPHDFFRRMSAFFGICAHRGPNREPKAMTYYFASRRFVTLSLIILIKYCLSHFHCLFLS